MVTWLYRWLPRIFGCHCKAERSFFYKGKQFPICARCTGELVGILLSSVVCIFYRLCAPACILLMIPMIIDGFVQMFTKYESNNRRRFLTGLLFGYALMTLFIISLIVVGEVAARMGREWAMNYIK